MDARVDRRRLLQGGAAGSLGITTLVLPGATAAASTFWWTEASTGLVAPTYSGSDALLAEWTFSDSAADRLGTEFSLVTASSQAANVGTATMTVVKGTSPAVYSTTLPGGDTDSPVGSIYPLGDDAQLRFVAAEPSTTVRVADGPYLELRVATSSGFRVDPRALVFSSVASDARLSVRSDADSYASSIRDFATPDLEARNVVVNLEGLAAFTDRRFRIYPYATGTANGGGPMNRSLFTFRRQFDGSTETPLVAVLDAYDTRQDSVSDVNYSAVIGLIGTVESV